MARALLPALAVTLLAPAAQAQYSLPLRPGYYVQQGTPCRSATFATLSRYDGVGFSDRGLACRITVLRRDGNSFVITETCRDLRSEQLTTRNSRVTPEGDAAYALGNELGETRARYRFCNAAELPDPWRGAR